MTTNNSKISIVIPCHNEAGNIPVIYKKIRELLKECEIVFIDDGSTDTTWSVIKELSANDPKLAALSLSRNFGHQAALDAGIDIATGEAVITMDADLQHPPSLIPQIIEKWQEGNQIVNTKKNTENNKGFLKSYCSKYFYKIFNLISETKIEAGSSDFRLISKEALEVIADVPVKNRFLRGLTAWTGLKSATISYTPEDRLHGESSYHFFKQMDLALSGITTFSDIPLKLILTFGILLSSFSSLLFLVILIVRFFNHEYFSGAALFGSFILVNTGIIIFILGIIAQYLIALYRQISGLPNYAIKEKISAKS